MGWTLKYYTTSWQTVTFPALAALEGGKVVSDAWSLKFNSHKSSTVTLRLPGIPPHIAPAIPFESRIQIIDPTSTAQFVGYRTDRTGTADPHRTSSQYTFEDEWYFLDHCPYQQLWYRATGGNVPYPNVVLFQPNPGETYSPAAVNGVITTGQQITDILNWAISLGANLQVGEIDPALYQAWYPITNVKCGDALRHCLRLHPDCFTEIDYTTTPPTFNVRQRSNLAAVTLPYAYTDSSGRRHLASDIQPRPELQPKRVALFYRVISSGFLVSSPVDIWPQSNLSVQGPVITGQSVGGSAAPYTVGGTPIVGTAMTNIGTSTVETIPVGAPGGLRALDYGIDLAGPKQSVSTASITTAAFDPTNLAWWQNKIPSLTQGIPSTGAGALTLIDSAINGGSGHPQGITVVQDGTNTPLDISAGNYAFELLPQSAPMAWMTASVGGSLSVVEAKVTAYFSYTKSKAIGSGSLAIATPNSHAHTVRVKLVNSASLTASYSQFLTTGEAIPPNLAENVYNSLATLQYSFSHTIVERPFNGWLKPGLNAINFGNSGTGVPPVLPAWTTMNATLQSSEYKMHLDGGGNTYDNFTVKCGPVEHLEPGQLVQLFNVFANRDLTKIDTNERLTGQAYPGQTVTMPSDTAQENSIPAEPDRALQAFSAPDTSNAGVTVAITPNPAAGQTILAHLDGNANVLTTGKLPPIYAGNGAPATGLV